MAQPFGVGDVVGGRYRITHHVVTSADQDVIFQAVDQVLDREVSVLLASRANAKQVATSAKELATGERASDVQVLDLGLSAERTYLIAPVVNPNQLMDLVIPDSAPYVEPYFTDSLGSELFGQSREMQPQTYHDDAEYYAHLQADLASSPEPGRRLPGLPRRRPSFLDKVTADHAEPEPQASQSPPPAPEDQPFSLSTDLDLVETDPRADVDGDVIEALFAWAPKADSPGPDSKPAESVQAPGDAAAESGVSAWRADSDEHIDEQAPSVPISTLSASTSDQVRPSVTPGVADPQGEEVIDDPPAEPDPIFDPQPGADWQQQASGSLPPPPHTPTPAASAEQSRTAPQEEPSFTSLIKAVPPRTSTPFPAPNFPAPEGVSQDRSSSSSSATASENSDARTSLWWVSAAVLAILVVAAAVILFIQLN